jgi:hypothetical protein
MNFIFLVINILTIYFFNAAPLRWAGENLFPISKQSLMKLQTSLRQAIGSREIKACPQWKYYISKGVKPSKTAVKLTDDQAHRWLRKITGNSECLSVWEPQFVTRELMVHFTPAGFGWMEIVLFHPEGHLEGYFLKQLELLNRTGKAAA